MPKMEDTWCLEHETLKPQNYPEVAELHDDISEIIDFAKKLAVALDEYNSYRANRIDVDVTQLKKYIEKSRSICVVLGVAPNVCYDLLRELRDLQDIMQTLVYSKNRYGSQFIGQATDTEV